MSAYQRRKGARGELDAAEALRAVYPEASRRASGEESQCDQGRDLKGTPGCCFQVAIGARPPVWKKLAEAERAAKAPDIPVALCKRDRQPWTATLRLDDFVSLLLATQLARRLDHALVQMTEGAPPPQLPVGEKREDER